MPGRIRPGDLIAGRYVVADLLDETGDGWFWRAEDPVLGRHVAVHVVAAADPRAEALLAAARRSVTIHDRRLLRVLDCAVDGDTCYVVNEWGDGTSLDILLARNGALDARKAAWVVSEVAAVIALAHDAGIAHGRLAPENVLIDQQGAVRVIGFAVEAALWGLPPGRVSADLTDLGGLLYAGLTARWAGVSRSHVPPAPEHAGRVLRPRKVRAGVPRVLDDACDVLLNPGMPTRATVEIDSARVLHETLAAFVGDPTGLLVPEAGRPLPPAAVVDSRTDLPPVRAPHESPSELPPEQPPESPPETDADLAPAPEPAPDPTPDEDPALAPLPVTTGTAPERPGPAPAAPPESESESAPTSGPAAPDDPVDQPTQAGIPVFDDDGVGWVALHAEQPQPPPPFDEPPERPLFAPAPAEGEPVRKSRPGVTPLPEDYWPWETSAPGRHTGTHPGITTTGHGLAIIEEDEDDGVPGRSWMRLAYVVAAVALLCVGGLVVHSLSQGSVRLPFDDNETTPTTSAPVVRPVAVTGLGARDFDPQGGDRSEHPELVDLAVDGDSATAWRTATYKQNLGAGGLKGGVGLVLDLGAVREVRQVQLGLVGAPTGVSLFLSDTDPSTLAGLSPVARLQAGVKASVEFEASGRYLVVWLTSLPAVSGGYRGEVAEVGVKALPQGATPTGQAAGASTEPTP